MTPTTLLCIYIALILLDFAVETILSWLNGRCMGQPIPDVLAGIYDEEKYRRQQDYQRDNRRVARVKLCFDTVLTIAVLSFGIVGLVDTWTTEVTASTVAQMLIFVALFSLVTTLLEIPFDYYDTFVIEERYGFNHSTRTTFWLDVVKSFFVSLVITSVIMAVIMLLYEAWGNLFWLWAGLIVSAVIIFFSLFYSNLIVPLFNKQTPLEEGPLREAIERTASKARFSLRNVYVINGSKRSSHANAYFTGFGPKKRIVLYDTLIEQLTTDEITAVLAHEMGHYRHHDILRGLVRSIVTIFVYLFIFSLVVDSEVLSQALGGERASFPLSMIGFGLLLSPVGLVISPISAALSRRAEYRADRFAAELGLAQPLIDGLKKLSTNSLSNLTPHPAVVVMTYDHPTLAQRVTALMNYKSE